MKIIVKKEFDGKHYIGSCENLTSCYTQANNEEELITQLRKAIELYRKSYDNRNQTIPEKYDQPVIDKKIRFNTITTAQLKQVLLKHNFRIEFEEANSLLLFNSKFPFNRIHIPVSNSLSPIIITKIFGKENVIYMNKSDLSMHSSA